MQHCGIMAECSLNLFKYCCGGILAKSIFLNEEISVCLHDLLQVPLQLVGFMFHASTTVFFFFF